MAIWISTLLLAVSGGVALGAFYRRWRTRRRARRRVVEQPNSHFAAPGVRQREDRERWGRIDLGRLHPVNRDEVERLLEKADALSADALSPRDRTFLDHLVRIARG
jgi:hypothetical protein